MTNYTITERRAAGADLRDDGWHLSHRTVYDLTGPDGNDLGTYADRDAAMRRIKEIECPATKKRA